MKLTIFLLSLLPAVAPWFAASASADERKVITSIAVQQEYTDNLNWSSRAKKADFISTISPALELKDNTERMQTGMKIQLDGIHYYDNSNLDNIDQDYSGTFKYALSSRSNVFSSAGYRRDSRIETDFTQTGLLLGNATRNRYTYRLGGDYAITQLTSVQLQYGFDSDFFESRGFSDYKSHDISMLINRDISTWISRTTGRINLDVTQFDLKTSQVTSYTGTIGAERSLDERFSFFADVGLTHTQSTFDSYRLVPSGIPNVYLVEPYKKHADNTGLTGKAGVTYKGEVTDAKVYFSRGVAAASGRDGTVERTALQGDIGRRLSETSRLGFSAGYAVNKGAQDELAASAIDQRSLWLQPRLVYTLTDQVAVETLYNFAQVHDETANTDVNRSLVMVRLIFKYTMFE